MKQKLFTILTLLLCICSTAWADETATFTGDNLNITSSSKTVGKITLSNVDMTYDNGLKAGGSKKTFIMNAASGVTISQVVLTTNATNNRYTTSSVTNCSSCSRSGGTFTCGFTDAKSTIYFKTDGGGLTITQIEVTYTTNPTAQSNPVTIGLTNTLTETSASGSKELLTGSGSDLILTKVYGTSGASSIYTGYDKQYNDGSSTSYYTYFGYKWGTNKTDYDGDYVGYKVVVADGKKFSISKIEADLAASGGNFTYKIVVENSSGTVLYSTSNKTIDRSSDVTLSVDDIAEEKIQGLTGTFYVKMYLYINGSSKYFCPAKINVTGTVSVDAPTYAITLDDNGEYQGNGTATVKVGDTSLTISSQASRTGYTVTGYYAEVGCETKIAGADGALEANKSGYTDADGKWTATENKTLYAAWEAGKYTLTITPNEAGYGSVEPTSVANIPYNTATSSSTNTFTVNGTTVTATPSAATAEYTYAFDSWTNLPVTVTEDATVTATFTRTPVSYELAWDANGDGATLSGEYTQGSTPFGTTIVKPTATRDGFVLEGWAATADGDVVEITTMPAANTSYYAKWTAEVAPTITVEAASLSTPQNVSTALKVTTEGTPAPTIQWYSNTTASNTGGTIINGATNATYNPAVTTIGTYYFYAVATNAAGSVTSNVITLTVAPKLNSLVYSNGFKAFIQQPGAGNGTIKAYYIAGTDAPTISSYTATTGAEYSVEGTTLTLTAADGVTTAIFDITVEPVTPFSGTGEYTFTASDTWVKTGNNFSSGWKIARSYESDSEAKFMVSTGSNRLYLFLAPSTSFTVTQNGSSNRDMLVSINGGDAVEKSAASTFTVNGDEDAAYMVEIAQKNSNGGDGKISKVTITKTGFESGIITASGWNTFSSSNKLDLSKVTGGTAYVATATEGNSVKLSPVTDKIVAANAGLMIKGTAGEAFKIETTTADATFSGTNLLVGMPNGGQVAKADNTNTWNYVFGWTDPADPGFYLVNADLPTLGAGKAYLQTSAALSSETPARLNIVFDSETTAINGIEEVAPVTKTRKVIKNGRLVIETANGEFTVSGARVK